MNRRWMLVVAAVVLLIGSLPDCGQGAPAKQEEVLKIVAGMEPLTLDISQFSSFNDRIVNENWGEFLLNREPNGKVTPGLASWKVSPDGKRMDLTLRKDVKFHSGDLFTAKDVLFSYERGNAKNAGAKSLLRRVDRVEIGR